jgi:hypothetical protein
MYDPLRDYLASKTGGEVRMTFAEVEELVGLLPIRRVFIGHGGRTTRKVEALAWRAAGWRVGSVSQSSGLVVFVRGSDTGWSRSGHVAGNAQRSTYVDGQVVAWMIASTLPDGFDHTKLRRLVEELNDNYTRGNALLLPPRQVDLVPRPEEGRVPGGHPDCALVRVVRHATSHHDHNARCDMEGAFAEPSRRPQRYRPQPVG